jgi:hypothetical protein
MMNLQFFCPRWGMAHLPFEDFIRKVKDAGYDGVEMDLPFDEKEKIGYLYTLKQYDLLLIGQHWETVDADFETHKVNYEKRLRNLVTPQTLFINSQTGKDYYSFIENEALIKIADRISAESGVQIVHETHRGKFSFAAHVTKDYLRSIPQLQLTLDASHWCNVAETLLQDQQDAISLAIDRCFHIHARVGYSQGAQVPDPRDPLWKEALDTHVGWWKRVVAAKKTKGIETVTITPEFGAPPYMILLPDTHKPIIDQWEVNVFMMNYLKEVLI